MFSPVISFDSDSANSVLNFQKLNENKSAENKENFCSNNSQPSMFLQKIMSNLINIQGDSP